MSFTRRAVIDVGTNSVKVLVADVAGREVVPVWEASKQTRLGSGFYQTHRLGADAIAKTARAVAGFAGAAHQHNAPSVRAIATSAARDATNAADLVAAIEAASGLTVEIISGDQEAEWTFSGVTTDPVLATRPLLILEVAAAAPR